MRSPNKIWGGGGLEYHISPGWKTDAPPKRIGDASFAEALMGKKERAMTVEEVRLEELNWLKKCAVGEVKNIEILNNINHLLSEGGFLNCATKYLGGLRVLVDCVSIEALGTLLTEGSNRLLEWFVWIQPWDKEKELSRPARMVWLNIEGVPLHVWNSQVFHDIAKEWGDVLEIEDLTTTKDQVCIGRVCIVSQTRQVISECINLVVDEESFRVRVLEDLREIMDFGPRYEIPDDSESSVIEEFENIQLLLEDEHMSVGSIMAETTTTGHEEMNR